MNTASLELCKELYELSGWEDTHSFYCHSDIYFNGEYEDYGMAHYFHADNDAYTPAYDLGYLLRKLPPVILEDTSDSKNVPMVLTLWINGNGKSRVAYLIPYDEQNRGAHGQAADTPEDAAAKLAIELFKQGVLTKEEV